MLHIILHGITWYVTLAVYDPLIDTRINLLLNTLKPGVNSLIDSSWKPCIQGLVNHAFNEKLKAFNILQLTVAYA